MPTDATIIARDALLREGLKSMLKDSEFSIVEELPEIDDSPPYENDGTALVLFDAASCDDVAAGLQMARARFPGAFIAVVSDSREAATFRTCIGAGADGYLVRDVSREALLQSLRLIMLGERVLPTSLAAEAISDGMAQPLDRGAELGALGLTEREQTVLRHLVDGDSNKEIARRLGVTEATVKIHMKGLLRKLRLTNRTQAAVWAIEQGIAPVESAGGD
ncbi:MAG: hypothetical protein TEF_00620 [Rhizobiales bacterium NRL2]|jgi:two-component system nitrate/nitrite response regulator NarL|nr:MAG: hypothetical protein TEF_00620 [Rhizobiales bacterium NRL2]